MTLSLASIDRTEGKNQGTMKFLVKPALQLLSGMNFEDNVVLSCSSRIQVLSLKYQSGVLSVLGDYF